MITRFHVCAEPEAGSLVRLLDPFAQRGLVPVTVRADWLGDTLEVIIDLPMLDPGAAETICARMQNMIAVRSAMALPCAEACPQRIMLSDEHGADLVS